MRCAYPPCAEPIEKPRPNQRYHSPACRWADWRRRHPPLPRCPNCGATLSIRVEEPSLEGSQRRSARQNTLVGASTRDCGWGEP